ncbi:hypothetical protein SAMN04244573_03238 [Azotobacter beijerinckii]|uniref:Uncharacterized protein n=1 Tax=Azotobacter beijerinckii TaxID=170623 RepID=A0A1H9MRU2_9GAMM|nr:hypothetical protein [Azotobacter beijerinckii]SER26209.1 hypothetical protein SAMN04244573_03238 [Azotobacter beijerinckii]
MPEQNKPLATVLSGAATHFTEVSQTALFRELTKKAAMAAGIEALALRIMETGDTVSLERIADLATALTAELDQLAATVQQHKAALEH